MTKYGDINPRYAKDPDNLQRLVEGQNLDLRTFLQRYELPIEGQRHRIQTYRQSILEGRQAYSEELDKLIALRAIDDLWADYLARVAEFRSGAQWLSLGWRDPHYEYLKQIHAWFGEMEASIPEEIEKRIAEAAEGNGPDPRERGAVWTYVTTDQPFGTFSERVLRGIRRKFRNRDVWG